VRVCDEGTTYFERDIKKLIDSLNDYLQTKKPQV